MEVNGSFHRTSLWKAQFMEVCGRFFFYQQWKFPRTSMEVSFTPVEAGIYFHGSKCYFHGSKYYLHKIFFHRSKKVPAKQQFISMEVNIIFHGSIQASMKATCKFYCHASFIFNGSACLPPWKKIQTGKQCGGPCLQHNRQSRCGLL